MRRALRLARRGIGRTSPNPMVGAVAVKDGKVVGEGYHLFEKQHHAEVQALRQAGEQARGADLYVTLEPCCHQGRTPPCSDLIIEKGVARVYAAVADPNPLVGGRGIQRLREAGVEVHLGPLSEEAAKLNETFFKAVRSGLPFVILKLAMTLDGRIATGSGDSRWITGEKARDYTHFLRYAADGILVGSRTVTDDDPSLDVRWRRRNRITKCLLDTRLATPPQARLFQSGDPVLLFHAEDVQPTASYPPHVRCLPVPRSPQGLDWQAILAEAGRRGLQSLLVEGGGLVAASLLKLDLADKLLLFYGPQILGGDARPGIGPMNVNRMAESYRLKKIRTRRLGQDLLLEGYPLSR